MEIFIAVWLFITPIVFTAILFSGHVVHWGRRGRPGRVPMSHRSRWLFVSLGWLLCVPFGLMILGVPDVGLLAVVAMFGLLPATGVSAVLDNRAYWRDAPPDDAQASE